MLVLKKHEIGRPNGHTEWFARLIGFTQLGDEDQKL